MSRSPYYQAPYTAIDGAPRHVWHNDRHPEFDSAGDPFDEHMWEKAWQYFPKGPGFSENSRLSIVPDGAGATRMSGGTQRPHLHVDTGRPSASSPPDEEGSPVSQLHVVREPGGSRAGLQ